MRLVKDVRWQRTVLRRKAAKTADQIASSVKKSQQQAIIH
jgi:hypothetical protein